MLSFLSPWFLAAAAAAGIPLILHLLKRQPEPRVKFAAVRLLKRAPIEHTRKRHLRELLLLALRVAALVLLALAFARPFFASGGVVGSAGVTIVAIDTSCSLSAPGQFERARQLAKEAVARTPAGDLVGVVAFADEADTAAPPSANRAMALSAIDGLVAGAGATGYRAGVALAAQAFGGRRGTLVVVTDLQENGWDAGDRVSVPESVRVEVADVGAAAQNLAVTSVRPAADQIVAVVRNTGTRARDTRVRLMLDGRPADDMAVSIAPGASVEVPLSGASHAATASVAIDDREGMQADNVRYAMLQHGGRSPLLVVTGTGDLRREAFYVEQALSAGAAGRDTVHVTGVSAADLSAWDVRRLAPYAAVLLLSTKGLDRRGREALGDYTRAGGGLLIAAGPEIDGDVASGLLGDDSRLQMTTAPDVDTGPRAAARTLVPADVRHPVFQSFGGNAAALGFVKFQNVARIGGAGCHTLARFTTGEPALLDCPVAEGHALVLASDLGNRWNDFPLHPTFVPFLQEAVRYLAGTNLHTAEYLVGDAPRGVARTPGFATLRDSSGRTPGGERRIAVNVDPREADPARMSIGDFTAAVTRMKDLGVSEARLEARHEEERQHLWQYLLMLLTATLVAEGVVASRTT
jgi:hypothetical protein